MSRVRAPPPQLRGAPFAGYEISGLLAVQLQAEEEQRLLDDASLIREVEGALPDQLGPLQLSLDAGHLEEQPGMLEFVGADRPFVTGGSGGAALEVVDGDADLLVTDQVAGGRILGRERDTAARQLQLSGEAPRDAPQHRAREQFLGIDPRQLGPAGLTGGQAHGQIFPLGLDAELGACVDW